MARENIFGVDITGINDSMDLIKAFNPTKINSTHIAFPPVLAVYNTVDKSITILTKTEMILLTMLANSSGKVVDIEDLALATGVSKEASVYRLRNIVMSLRRKLPDVNIRNKSGHGYLLFDADSNAK